MNYRELARDANRMVDDLERMFPGMPIARVPTTSEPARSALPVVHREPEQHQLEVDVKRQIAILDGEQFDLDLKQAFLGCV